MRLIYTQEFLTQPIAEALLRRGWEAVPSSDPGADLVAGKGDLVIAPALDYGRHLGMVDYSLVPGFGILAGGFAGIVKIVFRAGLETISTIAVKNAKDASAIVAGMLLTEKHGIEPRFVETSADADLAVMLDAADCALLSGDDAIFAPPSLTNLLDLADEWEDTTEQFLPYMLAWGRTGMVPQAALDEFLAARDEGVLTMADRATQHPHPQEANALYQRYLRGDIRFALQPDEAGAVLDPLFHYAFYHGVIADIPSVKFLPGELPEETQTGTGESGGMS